MVGIELREFIEIGASKSDTSCRNQTENSASIDSPAWSSTKESDKW